MLSTPLICASMGAATESPTVLESAPGYVVVTWTVTGVIVGYCSTGRDTIATSPAMTTINETTVAKIGRSMKNLENVIARSLPYFSPLAALVFPVSAFGAAPAGAGSAAEASVLIFTGAPACKDRPPSTTTTSPSLSPSVMNQLFPCQSPTFTGLDSALPSLLT